MRIAGGKFGGRILDAPDGLDVRPTQDRVREAFFSMVCAEIGGAVFLDLFAGSGAVGLEALSRGAASSVFVEKSPRSLKCLKRNAAALVAESACRIVASDVFAWLRSKAGTPADIAYADPPYDLAEERGFGDMLALAAGNGHVRPGGLFAAEMRVSQQAMPVPGWELCRDRIYGQTRLAIYRLPLDYSSSAPL